MSKDIYEGYRNSNGSLGHQGAYNAGRDQAQRGGPMQGQQPNESSAEYQNRQRGYNNHK